MYIEAKFSVKNVAIDAPELEARPFLSPAAKVEQTSDGAVITIADKRGTTKATIANGITPHIGSNGHWWVGETDTGVPASDRSAFIVTLTNPRGTYEADHTLQEIQAAYNTGHPIYCLVDGVYHIPFVGVEMDMYNFAGTVYENGSMVFINISGMTNGVPVESWIVSKTVLATEADIPAGGGGGTTEVVTDTTLTKSGAAADAKAVGDALAKIITGGSGSGTGSGGIAVTDDGNGNVTIVSTGGLSITDDGNGNVTIS